MNINLQGNRMDKMCTLLVVLVCVFIGSCVAQPRAPLEAWTAKDYPNPMTNPTDCGRFYSSFICDPNGILTLKEADVLDWLLKGVHYNGTDCPCSAHKCEKKGSGYVIAVALVKKLHIDKKGAITDNDKIDAARQFAWNLEYEKWRLGDCEEDVIIVYSADDQVVFTMTGQVANKRLTQELVKSITAHEQHYFLNNKHPYAGLSSMIFDYRAALADGGFISSQQVDQTPKGSGSQISSCIMSVITLIFCTILLQ